MAGTERVATVNAPPFASKIGEAPYRRYSDPPFDGVLAPITKPEESRSLRWQGRYDVGKTARSHRGGGHRAAAGFPVVRRRGEPDG